MSSLQSAPHYSFSDFDFYIFWTPFHSHLPSPHLCHNILPDTRPWQWQPPNRLAHRPQRALVGATAIQKGRCGTLLLPSFQETDTATPGISGHSLRLDQSA